jgi:hypothetical protein
MGAQVVVAVTVEAAVAAEGAEVVVVVMMEPVHQARKAAIIGVASRGTGLRIVAANNPRRRKRSRHSRPKRSPRFFLLRSSLWCCRTHVGLVAVSGSQAVMWVLACEIKGAGVSVGRTQVPLVHVF